MKKILIQLIGGQTLPNIFSLLSVVPDEVVNIYTKETKEQHEDIVVWCEKFGKGFGLTPLFREYQPVSRKFKELTADLDAIIHGEVQRTVEHEDALLILNMTGATKPMAAWAMNICMKWENVFTTKGRPIRIPIFYVDTQTRSFDFFTHEAMREQVLAFAPFSRRLTIKQIVESKKHTQLRSGHADWDKAYPVACLLQQQFADIEMRELEWDNIVDMAQKPLSQQGKTDDMCEKVKRFTALVGKDSALQEALCPCGLEWKEGELYYAAKLRRRIADIVNKAKQTGNKPFIPDRLKNEIQSAQNFLVGGWWEVLVAHAYQKKRPEAEVLWSVETTAASSKRPAETDVIATDGFSLTCISCKRRKHPGYTQELEQHCTRTEVLGGILHERIIAVHNADKDINNLATALRMKVWDFKTVDNIDKGISAPEKAPAPEPLRTVPQKKENAATPASGTFLKRLRRAWAVLIGKQ